MGEDRVVGFKYAVFEMPLGHPGRIACRKFAVQKIRMEIKIWALSAYRYR